MKSNKLYILIILLLPLSVGCVSTHQPSSSFSEACIVAQKVVDAVNENSPSTLYDLLSDNLQKRISKEDFILNAQKERSYPYLTPLYLYLNGIALNRDESADVECLVASRLPGEKYRFSLVKERGEYRAIVFEDVVDGSFIDKFDHIVTW